MDLTPELLAEWRKAAVETTMVSGLGEYTPREFLILLDAYEALAAGADAGRPTDSPPPDPATPDAERIARIREHLRLRPVCLPAADRDWLCSLAESKGAAELLNRQYAELMTVSHPDGSQTGGTPMDIRGMINELQGEWDAAERRVSKAEARADRLAAEVAGLRVAVRSWQLEGWCRKCDGFCFLFEGHCRACGSCAIESENRMRTEEALASGPDRPTTTGE